MKYPFIPFLLLFLRVPWKIKLFLLAGVAIALVVPVHAEEGRVTDEGKIGEIVVTGTRYKQRVQNIPANATVITEEDIENSTAQNIPDLMRNYAGVKVNDINGSRRNYTVDLRGFGETAGSNTLVLVDGRRVNESDLSGVDWTQIPIDRVERIEIVRGGSASVLYGDNATGGVVNIITKEGDNFKVTFEGHAGSYDTFKEIWDLSGRTGELSFAITGSYLSSDGYRDNSDTEVKDGGLNLSYYIGESLRFSLSGGYHKDDSGLPGALKESDFDAGAERTDTVNPDDFADTEDYYAQFSPEVLFWNNSSAKIDISYRRREVETFASFVGGEFTADTVIKTARISPQVILNYELKEVKNKIILGVDYQEDKESITNESEFMGIVSEDDFTLKKKNYGFYGHYEISPLKNLSLSAGYRYDKADYDFDPASPDSVSADENAYSVGTNYTYDGVSYVYVSYSKSFRYPLLDEYFNFISNSVDIDLTTQTSDNYEIGIRHYLSDTAYMHVNVFRIDTEDEIFFNPITFGNENLDGDTRREGVETLFNANIVDLLNINGSYTYMKAKIRDGQFEGSDIPDVPHHKATMGASMMWHDATIAANGIYVGERPFISDFNNDFSDQDNYLVFNVKLKYTWKLLTAFLDINNIFDAHYSEYGVLSVFSFPQEKALYPSPERNYLFGISANF